MAGRKKKTASTLPSQSRVRHDDEIRWVAEKLSSEVLPDQKDAPSASAWSLYQWASETAENQSKFWTQMFKSVAGKEKPDEGNLMTDDQRKFFRIFSMLEIQRPELLNDQFPRSGSSGVEDSAIPASAGIESCLIGSESP